MKITLLLPALALLTGLTYAQQPGTSQTDTWSNVSPARDDRYTNPKSKLYSGPNGWYNFGEVRATVSNAAKTTYAYKGGFNETTGMFVAVISGQLQVLSLDFGTDKPAAGTYQIGKEANVAQKKVAVSFADVSNQQIKDWSNGTGTLTVSMINGFTYMKFRNVVLQPTGMSNKGEFDKPMTIGFEGALSPP